MKQQLEEFLYKKIIRNIMLMSKLGRQSVLGEASTGYNFDHMYENKAEGFHFVGKLVDRVLLNLPAVQATRLRRINIDKILINEIENHALEGRGTRIVDIACGAGRYLMDVGKMFEGRNVEILGVDYDQKSILHGEDLANKYGIAESSIRFVRGNVFHLRLLKRLGKSMDWRPNIIISSGLTVYVDDKTVLEILRQVYEALDENGLFLVDSQESNPSRKLMEKVCNTKEGSWVLYYRPPDFWRKHLYEIGFRDILISQDKWNMYNLCTARKV